MTLTINIPVVVVVVVVVVVIGRCYLISTVFVCFKSYHDGQLSLLRSISCLHVLSVHCVLSLVTDSQW